jgi:hypothetical protein
MRLLIASQILLGSKASHLTKPLPFRKAIPETKYRFDTGGYYEMSFILADQYSVLVYEAKFGWREGEGVAWVLGSQPMSTAVHLEPK